MYPDRAFPKKLVLKKAISDLFLHARSFTGDGRITDSFRTLNYHSISDAFSSEDIGAQMTTPKGSFANQLRFLSENGYSVLSCDEAVERIVANGPIPPKCVAITLDDGFKDNLTNGLPILERYGFKATIFLTVDYIGKTKEYLGWDDIKLLSNTRLVSFGAHSLSHRRLSSLSHADLEKELVVSKKVLEDKLGTKIDLFAYPFGSYGSFDPRAERILRASGYKAAFTTIAGSNTSRTDPFRLRRTRISWYDDEREFKKELAGDYDWYSIWQRVGRAA